MHVQSCCLVYQGPLYMSPAGRACPVTAERIFAYGSYEKFQLGFRDQIRPNILATSSGAKCEKASKHGETQKSDNFRALIALAIPMAVSLQFNRMLMMWKIQRAMQDDAIRAARVHPGNRAELHKTFQPAYRDPGRKNGDLGNRASPPCHMNTSKILQRI